MPGQRPILAMSFIASLGITFMVLATHLPKDKSNYWPLLVTLFYVFLPLPLLFSRRVSKDAIIGISPGTINKTRDYALFFTSGLMISTMALPVVMARSPESSPLVSIIMVQPEAKYNQLTYFPTHQQVAPISCVMVELGNILCLSTLALFYIYFKPNDGF